VLNNLGNVYLQQGNHAKAENCYERALGIRLDLPETHFNFGKLRYQQGRFSEAGTCFLKALAFQEHFPKAYAMLGSTMRQLGKLKEALEAYNLALQQDNSNPRLWLNLGNTLFDMERYQDAEKAYQQAIQCDPNMAQGYSCLAYTYEKQGLIEKALHQYANAQSQDQSDGLAIRQSTLLPVIYEDHADIAHWRQRMNDGLDRLLDPALTLKMQDPLLEYNATNFYLAYQAQNNRNLQIKTANVLYKACPWLQTPPDDYQKSSKRRDGRIRVGFISRFLVEKHTIGKLNRRMIDALNRDEFDVTVMTVGGDYSPDPLHPNTAKTRYIQLPLRDLKQARRQVSQADVDILFYTDLGMDPVTWLLAMGQLAPIQATTWGHPDTTGLPTMQYFVSSRYFEPENASSHYSETLYCLDSLLSSYQKVDLSDYAPLTKADFGFDEADHLYLIPQTLFKMHPDNDTVLKGILQGDEKAKIAIIRGDNRHWTTLLKTRLERTLGETLANRVVFIEKQPRKRLMQLMRASEVCLDPLHFGGGNTTYEALMVATPVVTHPGEFMRSRPTAGFYARMGYEDLVCDSPQAFIEKALLMGSCPDARHAAQEHILATHDVLFENDEVIREFERFFRSAGNVANA
jgi:protein O-GlcNAc transferase